MKEFFGKVWKDPVWSKIIAAGVLAVIAFAYKAITKVSLFWWITKLIPAWWLVVTIFLMLVIFWVRSRITAANANYPIPKVNLKYIGKVKEFNKLDIGTVQWRWIIEISNKSAGPANFKAYCMKHDEIGSLFVPNERFGDRLKCIHCESYILTENVIVFDVEERDKVGRQLSKPDAIQMIIVEFDRHLQLVNKEFGRK